MADVQVDYDNEEDVLYVHLVPATEVARSQCLDDHRLIDYSADGSVVGIEFIDASLGVDLSTLPFAHKVEQAIGDAGLELPIFA